MTRKREMMISAAASVLAFSALAQDTSNLIAAKNMSMDARNVKIITINGRVTLRGPVDTAEEKRIIGGIADRIASSEMVDNQLEVKFTASNN